MIRVFKFGGASVKDADAIRNAVRIIQEQRKGASVLLVVSAMGKMTNAFEDLHKHWFSGENTTAALQKIKSFHTDIIQQLFDKNHKVWSETETLFNEIDVFLSAPPVAPDLFDRTYDSLIPFGELLSSCILVNYATENLKNVSAVQACELIFADDLWREGRIHWQKTTDTIRKHLLPKLQSSQSAVVITQGFVARSSSGQMITLGREGSDFSASVFAYALEAHDVTIWKDVAGLFNADPKAFDDVTLIPHLSYHEAVELAYYGQSIIHPKTIKPLQNKNIPLYIKSFINPELPGSLIDENSADDTNIPCFIVKQNQVLVSVSPKDFAFINEHNLSEIINQLAQSRIRMNVMQNSAISFSFCADFNKFKMTELLKLLQENYFVRYNPELQLITIRNYDEHIISRLTQGKKIFLEQRSRTTVQLVTAM